MKRSMLLLSLCVAVAVQSAAADETVPAPQAVNEARAAGGIGSFALAWDSPVTA